MMIHIRTVIERILPTPTRHSPSVDLMLGQRRRRWTNIKRALGEISILSGMSNMKMFAAFLGILTIWSVFMSGKSLKRETLALYRPVNDLPGNKSLLSKNDANLTILKNAPTCAYENNVSAIADLFLYCRRITTIGNTFVESEIKLSEGKTVQKADELLVLTYRMKNHPRTGINLTSVKDPITGRSCLFTADMSQYNNSDVVIIPARAVKHQMPHYRPPGQRWVFYSGESFHYVRPQLIYRLAFNHTMTYHKHSDIDTSKFGMIPRQVLPIDDPDDVNVIKSEDTLVMWMSSHCETQSNRMNFVKKLSKHVKVDMYGSCGKLNCPKDEWCSETFSQYKFYVAYENSMCNGYVTEKPWIGLIFSMVPLVAGGGSGAYKAVLPPNSYIDLTKFKSVKAVAKYLKLLDGNDTLYQEYFAWKQQYKFGLYTPEDLAGRTCHHLHKTKLTGPHIVDLETFSHEQRSACGPPIEW